MANRRQKQIWRKGPPIIIIAGMSEDSPQSGPCINCGWCGRACPKRLLPQVLHRRLYAGRLDDARRAGLDACALCGRCLPACPARIDLPDQFAQAKNELIPPDSISGTSETNNKTTPETVVEHTGKMPVPQKQTSWTIRRIMLVWLIALAPLTFAKIGLSGWRMAIHILISCLVCLAVERAFAWLRKKQAWGGAVIAGLIFAMPLSQTVPLWMTALGAAFGMIFAREIFGGLGRGLFHPAVLGWCFLASYSGVEFSLPLETDRIWPLSLYSHEAAKCAIFYILPFILLCWKRMANIVTPAVFLAITVAIPWLYGDVYAKGFVLFAAAFILADMPTSPDTFFARFLTGIITGLLTLWFYYGRSWHNQHILFYFVLFVGIFSPLLDEFGLWLRGRYFGYARRPAHAD
ncbi:MAG: RnfABCDGE type electron transport complex subunit D [Planctomycetes bacterium]|nr:RnfABCDGE type electron transport complex subunit D [Planctomycetota bacterium]